MLSYRHAFHAGNHADVLKHAVQVFVLRHLSQKEKPWWFVDTHAGAATYSLDTPWALKNAEFESGISRLWSRSALPADPLALPANSLALPWGLQDYVDQVRALNPQGTLLRYPGSPQLALQLARRTDRLRLFELHSTESRVLAGYFSASGSQVQVQAGDGFVGLQSVLPPPSRRGLVLIDPSYEDKNDYQRVRTALTEGCARFATGMYMVWYPQVQRRESAQFPAVLKRCAPGDWLHVALTVKAPAADGFGLHGSGVFILNPPWTLPQMLQECLPVLVQALGQDSHAGFTLEHQIA